MAKPSDIRRPRHYALFWRWHFFAALIVIPFVLWQSTTGTLYLWSEWWMDHTHPELRFVTPDRAAAPPSAQIAAALASLPRDVAARSSQFMSGMRMGATPVAASNAPVARAGPPVLGILLPDDPARSTTVLLQSPNGLAYPVFVNPHDARVLGRLAPVQWLPGWSRSLHSGWPAGAPGNWLLELGDCWAIVMLASGLYLWWPRGRAFPEFLWPRFHLGARVLLRDLHATVAVLFSAVFLFFLVSALPWTMFWGETLLSAVEQATGQTSPAGFSNGGASISQVKAALPALDDAVREARARGVRGTLDIRLSPWPDAPWWMTNVRTAAPDRLLQASTADGRIRSDFTTGEIPVIPRLVAFGVHVHQGDFGPLNLWLNTAFALSLVWLTITGAMSWWIRRPANRLGAPPKPASPWPWGLRAALVSMCVVLPIFGASVLVIALADRMARSAKLSPV
ncbi:MAG TPA: PepSY domain-containing protein [Rhizomicrobium sp.]|nr:PepSY domain-containing protein [Rhizomicrobium sp.]